MTSGDARTGSCLCGEVRFVVRGALDPPVACHCGQCRKQTGHLLVSTNVARADLMFEGAGRPAWFRSSDQARRGFCATCGSVLFWEASSGDRIAIAMGAFDEPTGLVLAAHIHVADKGDYYAIGDGLPQRAGDD